MRSIQLAASTTKRSSLQFSNTARQQLRLPTFYTALHFQGNVVEFFFYPLISYFSKRTDLKNENLLLYSENTSQHSVTETAVITIHHVNLPVHVRHVRDSMLMDFYLPFSFPVNCRFFLRLISEIVFLFSTENDKFASK